MKSGAGVDIAAWPWMCRNNILLKWYLMIRFEMSETIPIESSPPKSLRFIQKHRYYLQHPLSFCYLGEGERFPKDGNSKYANEDKVRKRIT